MTDKWRPIKNFDRIYTYMMFEVLLALVVVMFGIFGVSGMFPIGMSSQRQAVGTSYMTDAAEQLIRLNASNVRNDWDWVNVFANSKPDQNDQGIEWNSTALFEIHNLRVSSDSGFDSESTNNSGLFLIEHLTLGQVDQKGIVRLWKNMTEYENGSINAMIYAEVSWPAEKPYYAREKQVFSLQVSKAPEIALDNAIYSDAYCAVGKTNGGGYSTAISSVVDNGDGTYSIELAVNHDGCSGSECPELSSFSVEADTGSYSAVSFSGVSGALDLGPDLDNDDFQGFAVDSTSGIGNGTAGTFTVNYTLTSLQAQEVVAHGVDDAYSALFSVADFEYVLGCVETGDYTVVAADDLFTLGDGLGTLSSDDDYPTLNVAAPGVLANDTMGDGIQLTAVLVTGTKKGELIFNADGSFTYIPGPKFKGKDGFVYKAYDGPKKTNTARVQIIASDCSENEPEWQNPDFVWVPSSGTIEVASYFCQNLGISNEPVDGDGDEIEISVCDGPDWLYWTGSQIAGTPEEAGTFTWTLCASDGCNETSTTITITVECPDDNDYAPEWQNPNFTWIPSSGTIEVGSYFCQNLGISNEPVDGDGTTLYDLDITVCDGPDWLYWTGSQIAGTPEEAGTFTWTLCASDGCHETSTTITITVNP